MIAFLKEHRLAVIAVATSLVAGYVLGRGGRPAEKHEERRAETHATEEAHAVEDKTEHLKEHVVIVAEKAKGGGTKTTTTIDRGADSETVRADTSTVRADASSSYSYTEKSAPGYRLKLDAGWDPRALDLRPHELTLGLERRVLGPVWLGGWVRQELGGRPVTAAGLSLALEF